MKPQYQELNNGKIPGDFIMRRKAVLTQVSISRTTLDRWVEQGNFPAPLKLGDYAVGWRWSDIQRWIAERPQKKQHNDTRADEKAPGGW